MHDHIIEACARVAHEANRAFCLAHDDHSQVSWEEAPDWQKSSAYNGIKGALTGDTPEQSHLRWSEEKIAAGWVYGDVKDDIAKTHPCLVAYEALPDMQKDKDYLFVMVVNAMATALA